MERALIQGVFYGGASVCFYSGDVTKLREDISIARPTLFPVVPRVLNGFYEAIRQILLASLKVGGEDKRVIFDFTI